jgi:hypothetical protein
MSPTHRQELECQVPSHLVLYSCVLKSLSDSTKAGTCSVCGLWDSAAHCSFRKDKHSRLAKQQQEEARVSHGFPAVHEKLESPTEARQVGLRPASWPLRQSGTAPGVQPRS